MGLQRVGHDWTEESLKKCLNLFHCWLHLVFAALLGLSLSTVATGLLFVQCTGLSLRWLLLPRHRLWVCGLQQWQHSGSAAAAPGSRARAQQRRHKGLAASRIFLDQGVNSRPLCWQASYLRCHQGSPQCLFHNSVVSWITNEAKTENISTEILRHHQDHERKEEWRPGLVFTAGPGTESQSISILLN